MIGQTISHYKITEKLGEGGMGVVYKAEDLNLGRDAALKFLVREALGDEQHRERFLREARAAAALNHPNICTVYGIHVDEEQPFLAMEFIDGEDVKRKTDKGPLDLETALDIAIQAGLGLQAAHEKGIVHRDIKSANLMVTKQGHVKVADFGLALVADWSRRTQQNQAPGTPAYMSPEQAIGETVDRRTDIWALGVVLYEMVTGRLPFEGDYQQAVLYGVIHEKHKPMTALRVDVPIDLDRIVGKALAKDPDERYQHVEEALVDLRSLKKDLTPGRSPFSGTHVATERTDVLTEVAERATSSPVDRGASWVPPETPGKSSKLRLVIALLAAATVALSVVAFVHVFETSPEAPLRRFTFNVKPRGLGYSTSLAISPDGRQIAYATSEGLWIQNLDQFRPLLLDNTKDAEAPFWSPESDFVGFAVGADLKKIGVDGGGPIPVCRMPSDVFRGGTWSPDEEVIVFAVGRNRVLHQVYARGGQPRRIFSDEELVQVAEQAGEVLQHSGKFRPLMGAPEFLPAAAGDRVLLFELGFGGLQTMTVLDMETGQREFLGRGGKPVYARSGHIVYHGGDDLWAVPFSLDTLQASGIPFRVAQNALGPSVAGDGTLVYAEDLVQMRQLVWFDRDGKRLDVIGEPHAGLGFPSISPDGRRVAFGAKGDPTQEIWAHTNFDIWVYDAIRSTARAALTKSESPANEFNAVWSPSGDEVAYASNAKGEINVYIHRADGSGEPRPMAESAARQVPHDWSPDERYIMYRTSDLETRTDIWIAERSDGETTWNPRPFLRTPANENGGRFSPDGRYVAYLSDESGRNGLYVKAFPDGGRREQVSTKGSARFGWSRKSGELFYEENDRGDRWIVAVPISTAPRLSVGTPQRLFRVPARVKGWDVSADGKRFVFAEPVGEPPRPAMRIVQNWYEEFRDREQD